MLKMCGKRSFVIREKVPTTQSSLIEVVEFNPDQSQFAKVIFTDDPELKIGDKVLIGKYSGSPIEHENMEGFIVESDDVLAILE